MLKMTRSRNENFQIKNLQMVLNINSFEFDEEANKLNGRLTVVINIRQENQEYKFFKLFNGGIEQIFREGLKNGWILEDSEWVSLLNIETRL